MTVSSQIIEVINDLCAKFGVVVDWTAENMMPALQTLAEKYIRWEIATSVAWIAIAIIVAVVFVAVDIIAFRSKWDDGFTIPFTMFAACAVVGTFIAICVQTFDIIEATTFPEKAIFEYIQAMLQTS